MGLILISSVFTVVLGTISYLIKSKIDSMEADIEENKTEIKKFKDNYLDRFEKVNKKIEEVNKTIYDSKIEVIKEISKLAQKIK